MPQLVCCTAEVRQMQRRSSDGGEGSLAVVALGRQRARVLPDTRGGPQSQVRARGGGAAAGCWMSGAAQ